MLALGFSINLLTLFGLVVAIGIVVDDAIVVVEAVEHNMAARNLSARDANFPCNGAGLRAGDNCRPGTGGGFSSQRWQLAAQPANYTSSSPLRLPFRSRYLGFVALTLTPALCALWLKPHHGPRRGLFGWFNRGFDRATNLYGGGVRQTIRRWVIALGLLAIMFFCTWRLFSTVPSSFVPPEDQGYILVAATLPDGASLDRAENVLR